jgi:hypothetical protein
MNEQSKPMALDSITRAHVEREIKILLLPYLQFRLYVRYTGRDKKVGHYYGNEHQVTYNQCLFKRVPHINLYKKKGYNDLVRMIEEQLRGKYISAKLYRKSDPSKEVFDILCREYYKGELNPNTINDPILSEDEIRILYYEVFKGRVVIQLTPPENPDDINFKQLMNDSLS